jgi:plasmid maintenance system antidote protein VapI
MKSINDYMDDLKEKNGSDYRTAKLMGIARETISQIRKRGTVADDTAIKMADVLGVDRNEVLIAAAIARSEGEVKKTWENISKLSGVAASVLAACILTANDEDAAGISNVKSVDTICIMRSLGC